MHPGGPNTCCERCSDDNHDCWLGDHDASILAVSIYAYALKSYLCSHLEFIVTSWEHDRYVFTFIHPKNQVQVLCNGCINSFHMVGQSQPKPPCPDCWLGMRRNAQTLRGSRNRSQCLPVLSDEKTGQEANFAFAIQHSQCFTRDTGAVILFGRFLWLVSGTPDQSDPGRGTVV